MRIFLIAVIVLMQSLSSYCITIDGKFWDWDKGAAEFQCKPKILSKDRSGLDMENVYVALGKKYIFIMIEGRSVKGQKEDKGEGYLRTSLRLSFSSAQSPLNRVRILVDPKYPGQIKISSPNFGSKSYGGIKDKYWSKGKRSKYSDKYCFEVKIPIYYSSKGAHVGGAGGPLVKISEGTSSRNRISDLAINTVDARLHRLVDTASFAIKKGEL